MDKEVQKALLRDSIDRVTSDLIKAVAVKNWLDAKRLAKEVHDLADWLANIDVPF